MVYRTVRAVALDHIGHDAVIRLAFHLAVAHGADVDTGGALQTSSNMANLAQMSTEGATFTITKPKAWFGQGGRALLKSISVPSI